MSALFKLNHTDPSAYQCNRCGGVHSRHFMTNIKDDYDLCNDCNQSHFVCSLCKSAMHKKFPNTYQSDDGNLCADCVYDVCQALHLRQKQAV